MIETTVADVAVTILLVKLEKLLSVERFVFPGLRNSVVIGINELREILSFIVAENSSNIDLKSQLLPAVYFAEDFTENFLLSAAKRRQKGIFKILPTPLKPFPLCRQLQLSYKMLKFVKKLKDLSCEISKNTRHPITEVGGGHSCQYDQQQNLALVVHEDAEKELVARLMNDDNDNNSLRVISLVSKEALGKTALARKVYNRLDIRQHFQCRAWLDVPKDFKLKDVLLIILKHIPICVLKDVELMSEKELSAMLFQLLMDVRFLIVLDDVCTVDIWLDLAYPFPDAANGSRVILTTQVRPKL
uniref:NB-ARC domain-containing protein n=1 Tax=Fagus sylvatica TaxID=28930 RepID=A0A2N9IHW8_FAGSY